MRWGLSVNVACAAAGPGLARPAAASAPAPAMKWRRLSAVPVSESVLPSQHAQPRTGQWCWFLMASSLSVPSGLYHSVRWLVSRVDDRDRPGPAGGRPLDLDRKARHGEAG